MIIQTVLIVGLVSVRFFGQIRTLVRKKNCLYRRNIILDFSILGADRHSWWLCISPRPVSGTFSISSIDLPLSSSITPRLQPSFSANPSHRSLPFLLQNWLRGFPRLFTDTSGHIRFYFFTFSFFHFLVVGSWFRAVAKLNYVSFWAHVKTASRIIS